MIEIHLHRRDDDPDRFADLPYASFYLTGGNAQDAIVLRGLLARLTPHRLVDGVEIARADVIHTNG